MEQRRIPRSSSRPANRRKTAAAPARTAVHAASRRILRRHRPGEPVQIAEMPAEFPRYQRHHLGASPHPARSAAPPARARSFGSALRFSWIVVPLAAHRLIVTIHQEAGPPPHVPVEKLHPQAATCRAPTRKNPCRRRQETQIVADLHLQPGQLRASAAYPPSAAIPRPRSPPPAPAESAAPRAAISPRRLCVFAASSSRHVVHAHAARPQPQRRNAASPTAPERSSACGASHRCIRPAPPPSAPHRSGGIQIRQACSASPKAGRPAPRAKRPSRAHSHPPRHANPPGARTRRHTKPEWRRFPPRQGGHSPGVIPLAPTFRTPCASFCFSGTPNRHGTMLPNPTMHAR